MSMKRIIYPIDTQDHQDTFAWTRELAELTHCNLIVAIEGEASETEKGLSNQQISRLLAYYYQYYHPPQIKGNSPDAGIWSDIPILEQTLKFPEIIFVGALFNGLVHLLDEKEDLLVLHPQLFKNNSYLASIVNTQIPLIILPDKIARGGLTDTLSGTTNYQEMTRLFFKTLRRATKHKLPKELYEKLGRDIRIFNMIAAYFRKNIHRKSDQ